MEIIMPLCKTCIHMYDKTFVKHGEINFTCEAYPNGIPKEIWHSKVSHKKPYKNDNGIMYKEK